TGDDDTTDEPGDECVPESEASVTLCADRFWAQELDATSQAEMEAAIVDMPVELRDEDLQDPVGRARQLQWAVVATNAISAASVAVLLPDGSYDFTGLDDAHSDVPEGDFYQEPLRPKLFIRRDDVTLRPAWEGAEPMLTASGPGVDGVHHGRVFLLLDSSSTGLVVQGLVFRGDAEAGTFTDPAWSLHENVDSLYSLPRWGSTMVGFNGGANLATFEECRFERVNGSAISAVGVLEVTGCMFEGALPEPEESDPEIAAHDLLAAITAELGTSLGMDFHSGIRRSYAYGPTTVEGSSFSGFVQGVVASADGFPIQISDSTFTSIYDHGVYALGDAGGSVLEGNLFERIGNSAVKFAGHTEETDPDLCVAGLHDGAIRDNLFAQTRNVSIQFAGVRNEISGNEVAAYDPTSDPTGWYDPYSNPAYHYPDAWGSTEAGQAGWADHIVGNEFRDNVSGEGIFTLLLHQDPDVADRSISGNTVSGAGQTAYFHHLVSCDSNPAPCSSFEPTIQVEDGATLVVGAPEDCADCYPGDPFYITELP
ncbi:MAG: hypothetical protein QGH45_23140, partial [Myxococcota bacterium]|nr:hypothetical protein [Myxococcota bacterium]